jgi:hypothetical protein
MLGHPEFKRNSIIDSPSSNALGGFVRITTRMRHFLRKFALFLTLLAILPELARRISKGEFNYNVDETQHAFTGVFVADLIRHHPVQNPVEYAQLYYVHYPALSGILYWPPFFYLCEGIAFLLFGPSVVAARLVILLFAAVGLGFWFRLIEELHSRLAAVVATTTLAFCPSILLFEKMVMLEIPSLAMCIVASYFWIRFLRRGGSRTLYCFAVTAAVAMLTKQNAIYLLLFCALSILALRKWQLLLHRATLAALAIGIGLTAPYYFTVYKLLWSTVSGDLSENHTRGLQGLAFYWQGIPQLTGWLVLALALVGLFTCVMWNRSENNLVFISWVLSVYLTMTLIGHKETRYLIYVVPAVIYFAIWPVLLPKTERIWWRVPCLAILAGIAAINAWSAWSFERPYVSGYAPVARQIRQLSDSGVILVDADIPGNLIFFVRLQDSAGRFVVLRKSLYSFRIKEELGEEEYIHTREELQRLLVDDGVRFIVVSNRPPGKFPIEATLREMLVAPQFHLIDRYPVEGNTPEWKNYFLSLYENTWAAPPAAASLRIPMLTMNRDIEVPFRKLGIAPALSAPPN